MAIACSSCERARRRAGRWAGIAWLALVAVGTAADNNGLRLVDPARLDAWHGRLSTNIVTWVDRFDRRFGDARLPDDARGTWVRFRTELEARESESLDLGLDLKVRVALPALRERVHLVLDDLAGTEDGDDLEKVIDAVQDSRPDTALRFVLRQTRRVRVHVDAGLRLSDPVQYFPRLRARHTVGGRRWEARATQTVVWYSEDGWDETSELRLSRPLPHGFLFRSTSQLRWTEQRKGVTPTQRFTLYKMAGRNALQCGVSATGPGEPYEDENLYTLGAGWRRPIYRDWLFLEINPRLEFAETERYDATPVVMFVIEAMFGDLQ